MSDGFVLSENDVTVLKDIVQAYRQGNIGNHRYRGTVYTEEAQSQDIQLVIPEEDIPANVDGALSKGKCQVQTLVSDVLTEIGNVPVEAYNMRSTVASAGVTYLAIKTKLGKYVLIDPNSGSGSPRIRFTILSASLTVGDGALGCDYVIGLVTHVSCTTSAVSVGDEVKIYDPEYCHFNLPLELLVGLSGTATLMDSASYQEGLDYLLDCLAEIRAASCIWMIDTLCCAEEEYISG